MEAKSKISPSGISTSEKLEKLKQLKAAQAKKKSEAVAASKKSPPKLTKDVTKNSVDDELEAKSAFKDQEDDVLYVTGIDDEKEATELIKVGKLSLMSKEVKEKEFWVNTHVLQADEQLERMRKIARKSLPPVSVCHGQRASKSVEVEYLVRVWQDYLDDVIRDAVNVARHRGRQDQPSSEPSKVVVTKEDLATVSALQGRPLLYDNLRFSF
mmetsp:Transcript_8373/g.10049  ORF Transcript_8373/g.10049 Transcript_8373/m.10049 type:complete len:212 (+) Transcript_8373:248-883(+)|eukprot:CAMPEP_0184013140 /NCGR_PEP_ID=MMETSP0954-20121128/4842_1 /TAXON_ID=627963 /ORGANISM="Aplanochytrium sp, Strain PBS07" /LENGTH=211 /DNA_ID=CAMNT_0026293285 /DNA_START=225 /DNA_END=860 /DNA_ORIENTATION=+